MVDSMSDILGPIIHSTKHYSWFYYRKQIERRYASKREYSDRRSGESPEIVPGYVNEVYTVYPDYFETPDAVFAGSMPKRHSSRQPDGTTQYNNQHDAKNPRASHT